MRSPRLRAVAEAAGWIAALVLAVPRLETAWAFLLLSAAAYFLLGVRPTAPRPAAFVAAAAILPFFLDQAATNILFLVALYAMIAIGLNIVVGYAGLLDLGYVAFFAIGSYYYALLASPFFGLHWPFWFLLPTAAAVAAAAGILLGIPVLRLRGDYLAIVTLAFGEIIRILVLNLQPYTGGPNGIIRIDRPGLGGFEIHGIREYYWVALAGAVLAAVLAERLRDSRFGRAWEAMREDEDVARSMGIDTTRYKLLAFGTGAALGGIGGAVFAFSQGSIFPSSYTLDVSIRVLSIVIIGGMGSIPGVVLGSCLIVGLPEVLRNVAVGPFRPADYRLVLFGALLVAAMALRPGGILRPRRGAGPTPAGIPGRAPAPGAGG